MNDTTIRQYTDTLWLLESKWGFSSISNRRLFLVGMSAFLNLKIGPTDFVKFIKEQRYIKCTSASSCAGENHEIWTGYLGLLSDADYSLSERDIYLYWVETTTAIHKCILEDEACVFGPYHCTWFNRNQLLIRSRLLVLADAAGQALLSKGERPHE